MQEQTVAQAKMEIKPVEPNILTRQFRQDLLQFRMTLVIAQNVSDGQGGMSIQQILQPHSGRRHGLCQRTIPAPAEIEDVSAQHKERSSLQVSLPLFPAQLPHRPPTEQMQIRKKQTPHRL